MALRDNMISWWSLEEATASSTWSDAHGTNDLSNNSTGSGVTSSASGKISNCADFEDSSSERLTSSNDPGVGTNEDWSLAFWVNLETNSQYQWPFYSGAGGNPGFGVRLENDNKIFVQFGSNTDQSKFRTTSAQVSSTGTWYHIVVTCDISVPSATVYVNGSSVAVTNVDTTCTNFNAYAGTEIGAAGGGQYLDGLLDEVSLYNTILTSGDVSELYNSGSGISYADTGTDRIFSSSGGTTNFSGIGIV